MAHRVSRHGQVVIPARLREAIGLQPDDEVVFSLARDGILIERRFSPDALMGRLAGHRLVEALQRDRRAERRR